MTHRIRDFLCILLLGLTNLAVLQVFAASDVIFPSDILSQQELNKDPHILPSLTLNDCKSLGKVPKLCTEIMRNIEKKGCLDKVRGPQIRTVDKEVKVSVYLTVDKKQKVLKFSGITTQPSENGAVAECLTKEAYGPLSDLSDVKNGARVEVEFLLYWTRSEK